MKRVVLLFTFIGLIILLLFFANSGDPRSILIGLAKKGALHPGELRYRIYLLGVLPVGEAVLKKEKTEEYEGRRIYHLSAEAKSLGFFSKLFSGAAVIDSYVDPQKLNPVLFKQKITVAGRQDINKEVIYDQENNTLLLNGVRRQIMPDTQDPLSAVLNLKQTDFNRLKEFEMNINTNQKNYILEGAVAKESTLSINQKDYKTVLVKACIQRRDKNPYHKSNITMVFLKEKENIPILIKVFASGFLINAKLVNIE